ncbi:hypothetical protein OH76DRAFT_1409174 [Lentinus brumalis]|uniref:Fungal-type protein kinase domain-containing protein n=1 Tax=Lentinus brumalis TaxID=2498619 RepID=A0A371CVL1_9APHY|nr:hypothetical protein OH76DRAFT_1409174 [Polyporus brumalis]
MSISSLGPVYDAPLAIDPTSSRTRGLNPDRAKGRNKQHIHDARRFTVGPMPPQAFLDCFLPQINATEDKRKLSHKYAFNSVPLRAASASDLCILLVAAIEKHTKHRGRCPGLSFVYSAVRSLHPDQDGLAKPSICCYTRDNAEIVARTDVTSRAELGYAEFFIEVGADPAHDFFTDPPHSNLESRASHEFLFQSTDESLVKMVDAKLGQHVAYAAEIFARQHRTSLFSVSMFGSRARLCRWDRAGLIVSESFDIRSRPEILCDFLWRFSQATPEGRGHDVTIGVPLPGEEGLFRDAITARVRLQLGLTGIELDKAVSEHYSPGHVVVLHVLEQGTTTDATNIRRYLVSRPVVSPLSLAGRGTKGYWALDPLNREVVFVKDTWRSRYSTEIEGEIIRRMRVEGVRNIPGVLCYGDLPERFPEEARALKAEEFQCTGTDEFVSHPWACLVNGEHNEVTKLRHHRLVLDTVGYGLQRFRGTEELLHATYDVFTAMQDAYSKDHRIHRDISLGNIILVREPGRDIRRGYLIDWEMSCPIDDTGQACKAGRAGTWPFMSHRMQMAINIHQKHTLQDDMESLLYVILYSGILWLPNDLPQFLVSKIIFEFFEYMTLVDNIPQGSMAKIANSTSRATTAKFRFSSAAFQDWLNTVVDYQSDMVRYRGERWNTPEHLDRFWSTFLQTRELERDDRVVRTIPDHTSTSSRPSIRRREVPQATADSAPTPKPSRKRPATQRDAPTPSSSRPKRVKNLVPVTTGRATEPRRAPRSKPPPTQPTRFSQRVLDRQARPKTSTAPVTESSRPSDTARRPTKGRKPPTSRK